MAQVGCVGGCCFKGDKEDEQPKLGGAAAKADLATAAKRLETLDEGADYDPRWSPDGREIAFVSNRAGSPDVWAVSTSGGAPRPLTRGPGNDHDPVWSPDGQWLAFLSIQDNVSDVWVVPAAGGEPRQLTDDEAGQEHVRWTPDGAGVVFSRAERQSRLW